MSSKTSTREPELTQTLEEAMKTRLEAKFGKVIMEDHYSVVPNRIRDRFRATGMTPTEFTLWLIIMSFQYGEELPHPSIERLAEIMKKSTRTIIRYVGRLEEKGLLIVIRDEYSEKGRENNHYDFTPFYDKIIAIYTALTILENNPPYSPSSNGNLTITNNRNAVDQPVETNQNGLVTNTKKVVTNHSLKNTAKLRSEVSAEMSLEEDESREDESSRRDSSNLRSASAQNTKGTGLNGSSKENGSTNTTNNQTSNTKPGKQNKRESKNESVTPEKEAAAAPPAWSDVPSREAGSETKPPELPLYAAQVIEGISQQFHDQAPKSSLTIAARMYQELTPWGGDEYTFGDLAGYAKGDANKANIKKRNPDGSINRMPYFFTMLRKVIDHNVAIWAEEEQERLRAAESGENGGGNTP